MPRRKSAYRDLTPAEQRALAVITAADMIGEPLTRRAFADAMGVTAFEAESLERRLITARYVEARAGEDGLVRLRVAGVR